METHWIPTLAHVAGLITTMFIAASSRSLAKNKGYFTTTGVVHILVGMFAGAFLMLPDCFPDLPGWAKIFFPVVAACITVAFTLRNYMKHTKNLVRNWKSAGVAEKCNAVLPTSVLGLLSHSSYVKQETQFFLGALACTSVVSTALHAMAPPTGHSTATALYVAFGTAVLACILPGFYQLSQMPSAELAACFVTAQPRDAN